MTPETCCPRCGNTFHCGAHDAQPCACSQIMLTAEALTTLRGQYGSCLCLACLAQLQAPFSHHGDPPVAE